MSCIMLPRVPEWWTATIALIKRGAVYCPAPTMLTPKDLKYRVNLADIKMVITSMEHADKVDEVHKECPSLTCKLLIDGKRDGWISYPVELTTLPRFLQNSLDSPGMKKTKTTDPLVIFFTSGTTGEPKMVVHDHSYPLGHIVTARFWHDLRSTDVHFTLSDTGWAKSAWGKFYGQWIEGSVVFVYDIRSRFNATEILPLIEKYGITTFCCPPTIYRMLILADLDKFDFTELRHCMSAGEPLNPEVIKAWKDATGLTIYEGYGQTETVLCIGTFPGMKPKFGSMGKPSPGLADRTPRRRWQTRRPPRGREDRDQDKTPACRALHGIPGQRGGEQEVFRRRLLLYRRQGLQGRGRLSLVHRPR